MARTYLDIVGGRRQQKQAITSSAGAGDSQKLIATGDDGRIDPSLMPLGIGADTVTRTASESLSAGNLVSIFDNAGSPGVRRADATAAGKETDGFVISSVSSGQPALVYFEGRISGLTGLTIGARYYLSTTAGEVTSTPPSSPGNVVQYIGRAISTSEITFEYDEGVILATT